MFCVKPRTHRIMMLSAIDLIINDKEYDNYDEW